MTLRMQHAEEIKSLESGLEPYQAPSKIELFEGVFSYSTTVVVESAPSSSLMRATAVS